MGEEEVTANNCNNVLAHKRKRGEDMLLQAVTLFPVDPMGSDPLATAWFLEQLLLYRYSPDNA